MKNVHKINGYIYVTSDEKPGLKQHGIGYAHGIKGVGSGHYIFFNDNTNIGKLNALCEDSKTVILTNNPDLTTVQQLTPEEVNYLNSVDSCEVDKIDIVVGYRYKLLIPTEQPNEMSLDEAINLLKQTTEFEVLQSFRDKVSNLETASKKLYTENDMFSFAEFAIAKFNDFDKVTLTDEVFKQWFNQHKK